MSRHFPVDIRSANADITNQKDGTPPSNRKGKAGNPMQTAHGSQRVALPDEINARSKPMLEARNVVSINEGRAYRSVNARPYPLQPMEPTKDALDAWEWLNMVLGACQHRWDLIPLELTPST